MKELDNNEKVAQVVKYDMSCIMFTNISMAIRNKLFESAYINDFSLGSMSSVNTLMKEVLK
jgi:hypothetical protein